MASEREKLIEELEGKFYKPYKPNAVISDLTVEGVAEFILADRKRIVEPLVEMLKFRYKTFEEANRKARESIDQTLTNAGLSEEGAERE